jgi:hypothetical protein
MLVTEKKLRKIIKLLIIKEVQDGLYPYTPDVIRGKYKSDVLTGGHLSSLSGKDKENLKLAAEIITGFTPAGIVIDVKDLMTALAAGSIASIAIGLAGLIPGITESSKLFKLIQNITGLSKNPGGEQSLKAFRKEVDSGDIDAGLEWFRKLDQKQLPHAKMKKDPTPDMPSDVKGKTGRVQLQGTKLSDEFNVMNKIAKDPVLGKYSIPIRGDGTEYYDMIHYGYNKLKGTDIRGYAKKLSEKLPSRQNISLSRSIPDMSSYKNQLKKELKDQIKISKEELANIIDLRRQIAEIKKRFNDLPNLVHGDANPGNIGIITTPQGRQQIIIFDPHGHYYDPPKSASSINIPAMKKTSKLKQKDKKSFSNRLKFFDNIIRTVSQLDPELLKSAKALAQDLPEVKPLKQILNIK